MDGVKLKEEVIVQRDCTPRMDSGVVVKLEPAWSMGEDSPDQPSAVCSTAQPMYDNTSGSPLSLTRGWVCQCCSAAFVLVSTLELHLALVHGEPLPFPEWTESSDRWALQMHLPQRRLSTDETDHVKKYSTDSVFDIVVKREPAWSMGKDSPDQPSAVYSTAQPMSDNTSGSQLSLKRGGVCWHCSAAFALVSSLELHLVSVHGEELHMVLPGSSTPDTCDAGTNTFIDKEVANCGKRKTTTKNKIDDNIGNEGGKKRVGPPHVCDVCCKSFATPSKLKRHELVHGGAKPFVCDACTKGFTSAADLKRHERVHTGEKPYACPHCDSRFTLPKTLRNHVQAIHEGIKLDKPGVCEVCGAAFSSTVYLKAHRRLHTGEKPYVCSDCGKGFTHSGQLWRHRHTHAGTKPHPCPDCEKGFSDSKDLARHRHTHTGKKPHVCSDCGKGFAQPGALASHRLTHSGDKPHVCSDCGKGFSQLGNLKRHHRSHSGEKPHACPDCGKGFARSGHLDAHRLTHSGEKPHVCPDCGKGFAQLGTLLGHRATHSEDRPHCCPHCPSTFKVAGSLKTHMKKFHE